MPLEPESPSARPLGLIEQRRALPQNLFRLQIAGIGAPERNGPNLHSCVFSLLAHRHACAQA
jgi:hypothetical protein